MAFMITDDIKRMIEVGQKEIFEENFNMFPIEYPNFTTEKKATKETETYDSMGNLKAAEVKPEGDSIQYGKVVQAYQTSITNETIANGYAHSLEAIKYDLYGVVNSIKAKELSRTMREKEEGEGIRMFDEAFTVNLADGVPLCSNSKPLKNVAGAFNDTLATAGSITSPDVHKAMFKMFVSFKNHQNGPMKSSPTNGMTHAYNMLDIEEIYGSQNKPGEISNTKNVLPKLSWSYSNYLTSLTAFFMYDKRFEHALIQWFMKTDFDTDEDRTNTKNVYLNAIAMYKGGALPNIGIVGNEGA